MEGLIRRFSKKLQQSGRLLKAKKNRFYQGNENKRQVKENALRKKEMRETKEQLSKTGKLDNVKDPKKVVRMLKKEINQKNKNK
ncbi:MAG: hypothetical protein U5L76_03380 [Patescibacteria group bacterium]|nr:hypothetical protein [Patescibacteria group bacterium]